MGEDAKKLVDEIKALLVKWNARIWCTYEGDLYVEIYEKETRTSLDLADLDMD